MWNSSQNAFFTIIDRGELWQGWESVLDVRLGLGLGIVGQRKVSKG